MVVLAGLNLSAAPEDPRRQADAFFAGLTPEHLELSLSSEALQAVAPYLPLAEALGELGRALAQGALRRVEVGFTAGLPAQYVGYVAATALAQLLAGAAEETINAINAPLLARERGLEVAQTLLEDDRGYSNRLELRLHSETETTVRGARPCAACCSHSSR